METLIGFLAGIFVGFLICAAIGKGIKTKTEGKNNEGENTHRYE